ncbi:5-bromo-4-chloroindolyl phosphate hydrolysis family protein [Clostridiaceae bacterium OttesenSCG-928-D20]|nr:5-bromo-4-chloroindolyl phosphate hydrolysis family protein [Clostridiaceae bacterium OttesenSCG-928-D20]
MEHKNVAMERKEVIKKSVGPIYVFAFSWLLFASMFSMCSIIHYFIVAILASLITKISKKKFKPTITYIEVPKIEEPKKSYGAEIDAIIKEGETAQKEMGRLYRSIQDPSIRAKISELMRISDLIVDDAVHDPSDVPQIKRFLSYYLPTTIKLLNVYDRMGSQGIDGENIAGSMSRIDDMLDKAIEAYKKQLDSLFADQALDIETDIQVMNSMMAREGIAPSKDFK